MGFALRSLPPLSGREQKHTLIIQSAGFLCKRQEDPSGKNEEEKMYISSADFMTRNTERRVEIACPLKDPACAARIHRMIDLYMADNTKVRVLFPTGRYHKIRDVEVPVSAQEMMMEKTAASNQSLPPAAVVQRPAAVVFDTTYKPKKKKNDSD